MHDSVCHAHCAIAKRDQSDFSRDTWGCKSSSCHKFALCSGRVRQREGGEEEERRSSAHDYAIISLCRHTHEFLALQLLQVAVASSVEFSASAATFAHAQSIFQSFFTDYSTVFSRAQRPSQRSQLTLPHSAPLPLRCFILLRCIFRCASCSAVALRRAAFASASNVLVFCRLSLSPSLISILSLLCAVVRSSCSAAAAASCPVAAQP